MMRYSHALLCSILLWSSAYGLTPTYQWPVEFMNPHQSWQPPKQLQKEADATWGRIHLLPYFDKKLLTNLHEMRDAWRTDPFFNASEHTVAFRQDNIERYISLSCTFFDRGKDQLLIMTPGFTNAHQVMAPFVAMFPTFDVVLMDFRGHSLQEQGSWYNPCSWTLDPVKRNYNIDLDLVSFGLHEHLDILHVTAHFARKKNYKQVCGLGICYGAFVLVKTAALYPDLFDKIVIDGCWSSLDAFAEKIRTSPGLVTNPQRGAQVNTYSLETSTVMNIAETLLSCWGMRLPANLSLIPYAQKLRTPVLMFHGKDDLTIERSEFEELFLALSSEHKTAIITEHPHVRNHLYNTRELYAKLCNDFFMHTSKEEFWKAIGGTQPLA